MFHVDRPQIATRRRKTDMFSCMFASPTTRDFRGSRARYYQAREKKRKYTWEIGGLRRRCATFSYNRALTQAARNGRSNRRSAGILRIELSGTSASSVPDWSNIIGIFFVPVYTSREGKKERKREGESACEYFIRKRLSKFFGVKFSLEK